MRATFEQRLADANSLYHNALSLLPSEQIHNTPRYLYKRVAIRITELASTDADLLVALALSHSHNASAKEERLNSALLTACFVSYLALPRGDQLHAVLCALLLNISRDSHGTYASSGAVAQRGLLTPLLAQRADLSHYRQSLSAFQSQLGFDRTGDPKMDFPVRIHPFSHMLTIVNDFLDGLKAKPSSLKALLLQMRQRAGLRYHPALIKLFLRLVGPAPVTSIVTLDEGRAISAQYQTAASSWMLQLIPLEGTEIISLSSSDSDRLQAITPPPWVNALRE